MSLFDLVDRMLPWNTSPLHSLSLGERFDLLQRLVDPMCAREEYCVYQICCDKGQNIFDCEPHLAKAVLERLDQWRRTYMSGCATNMKIQPIVDSAWWIGECVCDDVGFCPARWWTGSCMCIECSCKNTSEPRCSCAHQFILFDVLCSCMPDAELLGCVGAVTGPLAVIVMDHINYRRLDTASEGVMKFPCSASVRRSNNDVCEDIYVENIEKWILLNSSEN